MLTAQVFKTNCVILSKSQKMKHRNIHNDLIFYLDGKLSGKRELEIREHLENCSECNSYLKVLKSAYSVIEKEKNPNLNPYFYQAVKAKIGNRKVVERNTRFRRILQPALFSVLIVAGISFGIMMGAKISGTESSSGSSAEMYYFNEMGSEPIESYFLN